MNTRQQKVTRFYAMHTILKMPYRRLLAVLIQSCFSCHRWRSTSHSTVIIERAFLVSDVKSGKLPSVLALETPGLVNLRYIKRAKCVIFIEKKKWENEGQNNL